MFFQEHGELQLRSDLLDCHVDVCSPEVLVQLSDNFDYQVREGYRCNATRCLPPKHASTRAGRVVGVAASAILCCVTRVLVI